MEVSPDMSCSGAAELLLRPLDWRDLGSVAALDRQLFGHEAWSDASWWGELAERPRRFYVVACGPGEASPVVGYAGLDQVGEQADVMTIGVAPSAQGRGLGARLLGALVDEARARGATSLQLEVRADNAAARSLYERYRFRTVRIRPRYYQPDDVDALVMVADLTEQPPPPDEGPR